ncbi:nucleotidyltransferase-like protein [Kribbella rubisoli]|uniref:Nucleotidyltransferase-like protein n=1 Tax=Kribbella rubisoli TaxID=3075929 RepID=A0A4Q7WPF3_9ACTN|nr:nucleotidyltransferase domain-containing protein [Kribbella rubisoli]RZU12050.1 nucleotidyltransferase-like protein [Kribbella rubisoli]
MIDEAVQQLLDGFVTSVREVAAVEAVWLHGSLALGDYQLGRSDLDVIVVTSSPPPPAVADVHRQLIRNSPLAAKLHCSYMTDLADLSVRHPTFAQKRYFDRPVTPVTRRELAIGNRTLFGPTPAELLPATTDEELFAFVRRDLREFWLPATRKRTNWYADIWVDLSLLTLARAHVTLATGDLITKRAALDVLPGLGAPASVIDDIRARRYGPAPRTLPWWRHRRGVLTRRFVSTAIPAVLS